MKILSVIITSPGTRESGGLSAGLLFSRAVAEHATIDVAVMAERAAEENRGRLHIRYFPCDSAAGPVVSLLPRQLRSTIWRSKDLARYISSRTADLVHFHNPFPAGALWQMCRACRAEAIPYVISGHGFVEMSDFASALGVASWKRPLVRWLVTDPFRRSVQNATHIFLTSPFEEPIVSALGVAAERQSVVTNGVNPFFLQSAEAELQRAVKERWCIDPEVPSFLFVGNHTINKGIDILLEAIHQIRHPLRVLIAGRIRSQQEHMLLLRKHRVGELGERVTFTDAVSDEELRALYQSVNALVFPSRADTLPMVVLEAMASGLPVIASRVGGIPYQITEETGILVPPNDSTALARAMGELAGDPDRRTAMGAAGRERVMHTFDWKRSAANAVSLYRRILERHRVFSGGG